MNLKIKILSFLLVVVLGCKPRPRNEIEKDRIDISFIENGKIGYEIVFLSCDTCVPIKNLGLRVVTDINDEERMVLKKITPNEWLSLLSNERSDFCANILLYEQFERSANVLFYHNNEKEWREAMKSDDLQHWKSLLK